MRSCWIHWQLCSLALHLGQSTAAVGLYRDTAGCSSEDLLPTEQPTSAEGEILLQAKQRTFKAPNPDDDEAPQLNGSYAPNVEKVGDGEEQVQQAVANVVHGVTGGIYETNASANNSSQNGSLAGRSAISRRRRSTWQVRPPLKEPAELADENFKHDKQLDGAQLDDRLSDQNGGSVKKAMHVAVSIMLLGFVALMMALFYLVNWPDEDIRQATWRLLSTTISIFLALLIFSAAQLFMSIYEEDHHWHENEHDIDGDLGHHHADGVVSRHEILSSFSRYFILWILLQIVLFCVDTRDVLVKAVSKLGSHIVAFAGVDAFATFQESDLFSDTFVHNLAGLALSVLMVWGVFDIGAYSRLWLVRENMGGDERIDKARQLWVEECRAGEHEAAGVILGLLLSQTVRFAITGHHAPLHGGSPREKTFRQVCLLYGVAVFLGVIVVPIEIGLKRLHHKLKDSEISWKDLPPRLIRVCRETLSMTMAWCFLYWGQWEFWHITSNLGLGWGSKMSAMLSIALILSGLCFSGIFILDFIADRLERWETYQAGFAALGNAFGLIMGLAWESCFREALVGVSQLEKNFSLGYLLTHVSLISILCLVVLPAWVLFIYPKSLVNRREDLLRHHHNVH